MASKKRRPAKAKGKQGKGLSGNPQRRARQLRERGEADRPRQRPQQDQQTYPWWAESHAAVLAQVRAAQWPSRLLDIETLAGRLAGDEFHQRASAPGRTTGLIPAGWLRELTETALEAIGADLADGGNDWPKLWAFACGLAGQDTVADLAAAAEGLTASGVTPVPGVPIPWYQPTNGGEVLVARDVYGDRFLLAAPFSDPAEPGVPGHWYAWDLDWCVLGLVVGAGVHDDADAALARWRVAVGPAAATAGFTTCSPQLGIRLLVPALVPSMQADSVIGGEPAEYFREFSRLARRAAALAAFLGRRLPKGRSADLAEARDAAVEDFLDQHAGHAWNAPGDRAAAEDSLDLLLAEWGPDLPADERAFFACSPHRIETCAAILRDSYDPEPVSEALALLPDWVQWCARRTELDGEFADRALAAARAEAATTARETGVLPRSGDPFRRQE